MEERVYVFVVGSAGSGKTYFTKAFSDWLDLKKIDVFTVNLDPGADYLPYSADVDVREWFTLEDIMSKYDVGPNGAQIIGADLISTKVNEIIDEIDYNDPTFVIFDTPGQMELFTLRASSEILVSSLGKRNCIMVYLYDPVVSKTPSGFLSLVFMASSAVFKLEIPHVPVLSKADLLPEHDLEKIIEWSTNQEKLYEEISSMKGLSLELFHLLREAGLFQPLIPVSSTKMFGFEDVYDAIQEIFYSGEDIESFY
ncbi:protein of unknown function ATP binding protein [Ferroglobus placidus DSM 10642]|uniref:GTPase n=1 Tax=Ferroglobus placidus (strain DSM 10642 / AEDII12DO) TaxID=589924 RepID=D3S2K8_FERPA|nr:ATP/GTP-binding protein [Ferroglobus placidus]ADC64538.1 protein of unknown function ATP binding protein [Ferroglobus placidus DSM 10642]